jgi:pimeloyl-ACP methyl ester carboxylesterase
MDPVIQRLQNVLVNKSNEKNFLIDVHFKTNGVKKDIVLFCHGFKGFKDWGAWSIIADHFAQNDFVFVKLNFSHNGTTTAYPKEFKDLNAFAQNNYSKEWQDILSCLSALKTIPGLDQSEVNHNALHLIGHSRGGGLVLTLGHKLPQVHSIIGWASVDSLDYAWKDQAFVREWQKKGYYEILNGRTKQYMRLDYQFYLDFLQNQDDFRLNKNIQKFDGPILLCHGLNDPAIPHSASENIQSYRPTNTELYLIPDCDHVFNMKHPYEKQSLDFTAADLVHKTINFIKKINQ